MNYSRSQAPYYDDYDPTKGYIQVLVRPEQAAQAREFNQIQSIGLDYLSRLGYAIYNDGAIIEGCALTISGTSASIASGKIFLGGLVREVTGGTVTITGAGIEYIGAKIIEDIVDSEDDSSLRDPAVGYENYGQEGANRLRQSVEFTVNASNSSTLYTLIDGVIANESENNENSVITETLARRTYDESGNYKVSGLNIMERANSNSSIAVTNGKAYIKGYEVTKPTITNIDLDPSVETETIVSEPKMFTVSSQNYKLNYSPVSEIVSVIAQVRVLDELVTRLAPAGGLDALQHTPVVQVNSVHAVQGGQSGTIYQFGRDYAITSDSIDWSLNVPNSVEPNVGTSYYVSYIYNKQLVANEDYEIITTNGEQYIKFKGNNLPVSGTYANVTYKVYLARRDLLLLDKNGEFSVIKGKSGRSNNLITPYNMDEYKLELGTIDVLPNSTGLLFTNYKTERLTQSEIYKLSRRIDDLEYNQALQDLDDQVESDESATGLKGIYTDGFIGFSKCDLSHPDFDCCIDFERGELTLPVDGMGSAQPVIGSGSVMSEMGRVISAPYIETVALSQPKASGHMLVNPYAAYNPMSIVKLNPPIDNWIDTETVQVYDTDTKTVYTTSYSTINRSATTSFRSGNRARTYTTTTSNTAASNSVSTSVSTSVSQAVVENLIEFMRTKEIAVSGSAFESGQDSIECYFNDIKVNLTPTGTTQAGTATGSVRANAGGKFTAKFTIPERTPCGTVKVVLRGSVSEGSAEYTSEGILRTITQTNTTLTTINNHTNYVTTVTTTTVHDLDPLAQSFVFDNDTVLTKAGLYFAAKDANRPVLVQVRGMTNGYPNTTVYAEVTIDSADVNTSENSSAVTYAIFNQPVYCKANEYYCIVVLSDSNVYEMFYGELAKTDILTNQYISVQPYISGVMFSSSNGSTWTAHQTCDMKLQLYKAQYTGNGSIVFDEISLSSLNRLILAADYIDYKNAGISWHYRYRDSDNNWTSWFDLDAYLERELESSTTKVQLKAELNVAYSTSPFIARDCVNLITFTDGVQATYVSRAITLSEPYNKLKIGCQFYLPSQYTSCGFEIYYSPDGTHWKQVTETPTTTKINDEFYDYVYEISQIDTWDSDEEEFVNSGSSSVYRIKVVIHTNNVFYRPRARKLRSILKY